MELAQKIRYDEKRFRKPKKNAIVGVSRGGLVLARMMSDLLGIQNVLITKTEYYAGLNNRNKKPIITQKIQNSLTRLNVLLVDDVADTGESLSVIKKYIENKKPKSLTVATLYLKPWSRTIPDYYVSKTDAWIIFPWELYESLGLLNAKGGAKLVGESGISKRVIDRLKRYEQDCA